MPGDLWKILAKHIRLQEAWLRSQILAKGLERTCPLVEVPSCGANKSQAEGLLASLCNKVIAQAQK